MLENNEDQLNKKIFNSITMKKGKSVFLTETISSDNTETNMTNHNGKVEITEEKFMKAEKP